MADYDTALAQDPGHTRLLVARSYAWMAQGRYDKARMDLGAALAVGSLDAYVLNELAWFLATCPEAGYRDGKRAVSLASEAMRLSLIPSPGHYDTLAAALAEAGRYEDAAEAEAVALQSAAGEAHPVWCRHGRNALPCIAPTALSSTNACKEMIMSDPVNEYWNLRLADVKEALEANNFKVDIVASAGDTACSSCRRYCLPRVRALFLWRFQDAADHGYSGHGAQP